MSVGDPVEAMARRLRTTARRYGLHEDATEWLDTAFRLAAQPRQSLASNAPALLHPARTALILFDAVTGEAASVLAAATLVESQDHHLAVPPARIEEQLDDAVAALVAAVPTPASAQDELLEQLLVAPASVRRLALAEQLDHARHLHLCPQPLWARRHDLIQRTYLPVAEWEGGALGRRFRWWHDMFERRYLSA